MAEPYKFPDEVEDKKTADVEFEIEGEGEIEIEIEDDTPERDRGRKPLDREVLDPTDEEIESYSDKVKGRIKELTHARHDERRVKEATMREKQELERLAQQLIEENKNKTSTQDKKPSLKALSQRPRVSWTKPVADSKQHRNRLIQTPSLKPKKL